MHPFAQKQWALSSNSKFKTFSLSRGDVELNVNASDVQNYFHLIKINDEERYMPKLNYRTQSLKASQPSTPLRKIPCVPRNSPAYQAFEKVVTSNIDLNEKLKNNLKDVHELTVVKCDVENQKRPFFTEAYHCSKPNIQHHTLKYFFGMTNKYGTFVKLVCGFHFRHGLQEAHSKNKYEARLTNFEQCLAAKL